MLRRAGRSTWLAGLLFLAAAPFAAAQTDDAGAPGADLVEKAQARFAIGDISGPDGEGRYHLPKASSEDVRAARRLLEQAAPREIAKRIACSARWPRQAMRSR
jgi:hypothetical protein